MTVKRDTVPDAALAGTSQTVCGTSASLSANNPSVGQGLWYVLQGNGTLLSNVIHSTSITGLTPGENIFLWKIKNGVCPESADTVSIFADEIPSSAAAGADQRLCSTTASMNGVKPAIGTGSWELLEGTATVMQPSSESSMIEGLTDGLHKFIWKVTNGVCPPWRDTIEILVDKLPSAAAAGQDRTVCGAVQPLSAAIPAVGAGTWKSLDEGSIEIPSAASTTVSGLKEGVNLFVWTVSNGVCPASNDTLQLHINLPPENAFAGSDRTVCSSSFFLAADDAPIGAGAWKILTGMAELRETNNPKSSLRLLSDSLSLSWTVVNGVCPATSDEIVIVRDTILPIAIAGNDIITENVEVTLSATPDLKYPGAWAVLEGSAQLNDPNDARSKVRNLSVGNNRFQWQVKKGECAVATDEVLVYLKEFSIPNAFSPNDDGFNDRFHINGLENFEAVRLQIFNRWGTLLFEDADYRNTWNGTSMHGEKMADDTYYYVLEIPGKENYTGFIILKRNK